MNEITPQIYEGLELRTKDLQGWNGESPIFAALVKSVCPRHIIEVGTWKGQSAITMARAVKEMGLPTRITCVDTWLGALEFWHEWRETPERNLQLKHGYPQVYFQFLSNVVHEGMEEVILPFPNTSMVAAKYFQSNAITAELIYIDGSHDYVDVLSDCAEYWKILSPGGVLFGDDWGWASVRSAVEHFAKEQGREIRVHEGNHWIIEKP